ncbi:MAG: aldehyde dehydrogenase family protein [Actinobacteria bacterium]|nr:aldehyde dehydrogenase family protein [Actinomycetota bacterium]
MTQSTIAEARARVASLFEQSTLSSGVYAGRWIESKGRDVSTCISPIDGEIIGSVSLAHTVDYEEVLESARCSAQAWSEIPAPVRGYAVLQVAEELERHKKDLGLLVSLEVGKTVGEGQGEIQEMIDIGRFAAGLSRQLYGLTMPSERTAHRLQEQWHPLGPIGVITAFNFPSAVWSWNAFIAAVVGDVTIWKPSSDAPLTAIAVTRLANDVLSSLGHPPVFLLLCGNGRTVGERLLDDRRLPLISFTGSVSTGRHVATRVASRLGRSLLELGGNNAAVVSEKADMEMGLRAVAFGALATSGQRCTSTRRLIVQESIYRVFLDKLTRLYSTVGVGNPLEANVLVGPLINRAAVDGYLAAIEEAQKQGGRLLCGGREKDITQLPGGFYVEPTIIEAESDMPILQQETFAPILYALRYSAFDEAVAIHNSVPQGLSSAIFTTDLREAEQFLAASGSDCGLVNVNTGTAGAEIGGAFGGEKDTGGGRESGSDAWKAYARRQTACVNYGRALPLAQGVRFDID